MIPRIFCRPWKSLMADPKTVDLSFINRDVETQLDKSREAIDVAQTLTKVLPSVQDEEAKKKIE